MHPAQTTPSLQLLTAIKNGYISRVESLLNQGHSPNGGFDSSNPLYRAIEGDKPEILSLLIQRGADVDSPIEQSKSQTALHRAVMRGSRQLVSTILEHSRAAWNATDGDGATVLHLAMQVKKLPVFDAEMEAKKEEKIIDILKIFLDLGADVDAKTNRGETALFVAGKYRMRKVVEFLMSSGANLNARDRDGNSLVHCLLKDLKSSDNDKISKEYFVDWLLTKGADANSRNAAGETPLQLAARSGSRYAIDFLLKHVEVEDLRGFRDERDRTLLHVVLALSVRKPWQDKRLAHVNSQSDPENPEPEKASQVEKMVDFLLDKGLSVDDVDAEGNTAFHLAVKQKKWFAVPKLLKHFGNVNARNERGQTALHVMLDFFNPYQRGYKDAVEALMSRGADIEARDDDGLSPVQLAAKNKHLWILRSFAARGADLKVRTASGESLLHIAVGNNCNRPWSDGSAVLEMLLDEGHCQVDAATADGLTPLLVALEACNNVNAVKALIERGAGVNCRDRYSRSTPILVAARKYENAAVVEALIAAGADVNAEDAAGKTALHFAVERRACEVVRKLLRAGTYCDVVDRYGYTPLYYALKLDKYEAVALLLEAGASIEGINVASELRQLCKNKGVRECLAKLAHARLPIAEAFGLLPSACLQDESVGPKFHDDCRGEVARMKAARVDGEKTLLDFVRLSLERRIRCLRDNEETLSGIVEVASLEKSFPRYCNVILGRYLQAVERKSLLERGESALRRIVGFAMPDICEENVFRRLSNRDLKGLIEAVGFGVEKRPLGSSGDDGSPEKRQRTE